MALKAIQLSTDHITVAEFKDHAGTYLDRVQSTGHPIVITKNGKAAGVIVSPEEYDRIYTQQFTESVAKGVADLERLFEIEDYIITQDVSFPEYESEDRRN